MFQERKIKKLKEVFDSKGWTENKSFVFGFDDLFDKGYEVSIYLSDEEFELFCLLLNDFTWLPLEKYPPSLNRALQKMPAPDKGTILHLAPIIAPKDVGKDKSGSAMLGPFHHTVWKRSATHSAFQLNRHTDASNIHRSGPHIDSGFKVGCLS